MSSPPSSTSEGRVRLGHAPLSIETATALVAHAGAGAIDVFVGVVRDHAEGRAVSSLEYSAYEPMALKELARILAEVEAEIPGARCAIHHRLGLLRVGELAIVCAASTPHRAESFAACRALIERVKHRVPIWKRESGPDGVAWVGWQDARCGLVGHAHDRPDEVAHAAPHEPAHQHAHQHAGEPAHQPATRSRYRFEGPDDALTLLPLAARRALDAGGRKLGLEAWTAMPFAARAALVEAGAAGVVDPALVRALVAEAPTTELAARPEPRADEVPAELTSRVSLERWRALRALDRWALASLASRGRQEALGHALGEILGA